MTLLSFLLSWFPALVFFLALGSGLRFVIQPGIFPFLALIFCLYLFPLVVYRIHQIFYPVTLGLGDLKAKEYNPWWGVQQIQQIYNTFPFLEKILHLIPGLFSIWLRLWGAKIGRNVYWVASVTVLDRGLIEVGDNVIFGHLSTLCSHVVTPKNDRLLVYVQTIKIGNNVFIGAEARLGPGAFVADGALIPYCHRVIEKNLLQNLDRTPQDVPGSI